MALKMRFDTLQGLIRPIGIGPISVSVGQDSANLQWLYDRQLRRKGFQMILKL